MTENSAIDYPFSLYEYPFFIDNIDITRKNNLVVKGRTRFEMEDIKLVAATFDEKKTDDETPAIYHLTGKVVGIPNELKEFEVKTPLLEGEKITGVEVTQSPLFPEVGLSNKTNTLLKPLMVSELSAKDDSPIRIHNAKYNEKTKKLVVNIQYFSGLNDRSFVFEVLDSVSLTPPQVVKCNLVDTSTEEKLLIQKAKDFSIDLSTKEFEVKSGMKLVIYTPSTKTPYAINIE